MTDTSPSDEDGLALWRQMPAPFQQQDQQPLAASLRPILPDLLAHAPCPPLLSSSTLAIGAQRDL
ncbi:hypothetical protein [Streptomyces canus]|uniref:hypothetical protein n=1 Tax=Streptomyces canus TaxID=58343 RepID=UPI002E270EBF